MSLDDFELCFAWLDSDFRMMVEIERLEEGKSGQMIDGMERFRCEVLVMEQPELLDLVIRRLQQQVESERFAAADAAC